MVIHISMDYAVVRFADGTTSEIPKKWLTVDETQCYWPHPKPKNAGVLISKQKTPEKTWTKHKIELEVKSTSLEKARKKAEDMGYTTSEENNTVDDSKRLPKKKTNKDYLYDDCGADYDAEGSDESDISVDNSVTSINDYMPQPKLNNKDDNFAEITNSYNIDDIPIVVQTSKSDSAGMTEIVLEKISDCNSNKTISISSSAVSDKKLETILDTLLILKEEVKEIKSILIDRKLLPGESNIYLEITTQIPAKTIEEIQALECFLKPQEKQFLFKKYIYSIGGNGPKDNIYRICRKVFSDDVAVNCSWMGQRNNFRISDLISIKLMKELLFGSYQMREKEFENITSEWFRHARQRLNRRH